MNISEKNGGFWQFLPAAWLRVTGEDALSFLQGQVTQDLKTPSAGSVVYGLWLTQKGRVVADSLFFKVSDQEFWVLSEGTPSSVLRERMESYIIADDVIVEDPGPGWAGLLAAGHEAVGWVKEKAEGSVEAGRFLRVGRGFLFEGRRGLEPSIEWISDRLPELPSWGGAGLSQEDLDEARLRAGIPAVPGDVGPGELPNEAGLEEDALSYVKGCYLGQETMARLKAMGQIRRKLLRVSGEGVAPTSRPQLLFQDGKRVGELRTTAPLPEGGYLGFALVTLLGFDPKKGLSLAPDGMATLRVGSLPSPSA